MLFINVQVVMAKIGIAYITMYSKSWNKIQIVWF